VVWDDGHLDGSTHNASLTASNGTVTLQSRVYNPARADAWGISAGVFTVNVNLAVALTGSPIVVIMIGIGYILNSFQIANNIMIGTSRIMVAASLDRAMPEWFSRVNEKFHTPVNALSFFFVCSIFAIVAYNNIPGWIALTLGVTFGGGLGFALGQFRVDSSHFMGGGLAIDVARGLAPIDQH